MRHSRFTYQGAYHHITSRGLNGEPILNSAAFKEYFLKLLNEAQKKYHIKVFAYCLMDNHYHLVLQNTSGRLGEFMRYLNGTYGKYYRKMAGGKGYVFQDRYYSTLIQDEGYLLMAMTYVLLNPVRAGIVKDPYYYPWSSISHYFSKEDSGVVDNTFIESILGDRTKLEELLSDWGNNVYSSKVKNTPFGKLLGDNDFIFTVEKKFNRRKEDKDSLRRRREDYPFMEISEIIMKFEKENRVKVEEIDTRQLEGKRLRAQLLVMLRDLGGLKYRDIIKMPLFKDMRYSSLGTIYKRAKGKK